MFIQILRNNIYFDFFDILNFKPVLFRHRSINKYFFFMLTVFWSIGIVTDVESVYHWCNAQICAFMF